MRVGIIGNGVVGSAIARTYLGFVDEVRAWDALEERSTHDLGEALECDLIFVCLPEGQVEGFFRDRTLRGVRPHAEAHYVVKSTVPIGTTRRLADRYSLPSLCHSPEFLTERCAFVDALTPARHIIGVPQLGNVANNCAGLLLRLYHDRFPGVQLLRMSSDESEAVKLFTNAFFATKVAFFNECRTLADKLGLSWDAVMAGVLSDGRIAHSHTSVPGHDGRRGFGGKCLEKDAAALALAIEEAGQVPHVVRAALTRNVEDRRQDDAPAPAVVHYAPHGPDMTHRFYCGAPGSEEHTGLPRYVTCDACKRASPGLWPEYAAE